MFALKGYLSRATGYVIDLDGRSQNSYPYQYRISHSEKVGETKERSGPSLSVYLLKKKSDYIFHATRDNPYRCI